MSKTQDSKLPQHFEFCPPAWTSSGRSRAGILKLFRDSRLEIRNFFCAHAQKERGFTIMELVVGLGLFVVLSGGFLALTLLYSNSGRILPGGMLSAQVRRLHRIALEDMKEEVKQSNSFLQNYTVATTTYTTGTTTLALRLYSLDAANNIIPGYYDYVVYYTNTTTPPITLFKIIVVDANSTRQRGNLGIHNAVRSLAFTYNTSSPAQATKAQVYLESSKTIGSLTEGASTTVEFTRR